MGFGADHSGSGELEALRAKIEASHGTIYAGNVREEIAAEIAAHATDDSEVSDAYRHAAMIAAGTWGAGGNA